jgi:proton glutamate symport protein
MFRSSSVRVLLSLIAGLGLGAAASAYGGAAARPPIEALEAVGQLWLNGLRMTVVPLIFSTMVVGVGSVVDAAATGRLALKALAWFAGLLAAGSVFSLAFAHALYALWPLGEGVVALRAGGHSPAVGATAALNLGDFLKGLAPSNPIKAAADNAILPLVVFAAFFGLAVSRLPEGRRRVMIQIFDSLAEAMVIIVRWVLLAAPVGVFALALGVGLKAGVGTVGVIAHYVVAVSLAVIVVTMAVYAAAVALGGVPLGRWARAMAPVQVTAFATQSSLACLPAMIERARDDLGVSERVAGLVLPLAVSIFRLSNPVANLAVAMFVAQVYGLHPSALQYGAALLVAFAVSLGVPGLPSQVNFFLNTVPLCTALGLPLDLLPILIAVEVVPDIFRTLGSVTGDMAVTVILAREERAAAIAQPAGA